MITEVEFNQCLEAWRSTGNQILKKINAVHKPGSVTNTMIMVSKRIIGSGESLAILRNNSPHDWRFDGASILRTIYDVMIQGLYIMADPVKQDERANLYLDYMIVEQVMGIKLYDSNESDIAKLISASPKRCEAEPEIKKKFVAVKPQFMDKKGNLRKTWYRGNLRVLAKESGHETEYELMQNFLSGIIHSSPFTLYNSPFMHDYLIMDWYWRFSFRIIGAYAGYMGVTLVGLEKALIDDSRPNVFNGTGYLSDSSQ